MELAAAIEHIRTEALPKELDEGTKKTWGEVLDWLEELLWRRQGEPEPDCLDELERELKEVSPDIAVFIRAPRSPKGVWFVDVYLAQKTRSFSTVVMYKPTEKDKPWGVERMKSLTSEEDPAYGMGPDETLATLSEVVAHIRGMVESLGSE